MQTVLRRSCALALLLPMMATAKVSPDEAARLQDGGDLTPLGAERAGNDECQADRKNDCGTAGQVAPRESIEIAHSAPFEPHPPSESFTGEVCDE